MTERRYSTCSVSGAFDRFIPYRPNLDVDSSYARLMSCSCSPPLNDSSEFRSPASKSYNRRLTGLTPRKHGSILPITCGTPRSPFSRRLNYLSPDSSDEGYHSPTKVCNLAIPTSPECIMDMPGLRDDFYTNVLDWNSENLIAVALNQSTYIWNAESKQCQRIDTNEPMSQDAYVSSLAWGPSKHSLVTATSEGTVQVWDVEKMTSTPVLGSDVYPGCAIGSVQWTQYGIVFGNKSGDLCLCDIRTRGTQNETGSRACDICGLCMATGTPYLASGNDDGDVSIWDLRMIKRLKVIKAHNAGVKALAWCPWRQGVLATGGGSDDGHIRLWFAHSGEKLGEAVTKAQVCGIVWSEEYREMVSAVGSPVPEKNDLVVWRMKQHEFEPLVRLRQHMARPLHIAISPDRTSIASAGADESLCLWNTFPRKSRGRQWTKWERSPINFANKIR